MAMNGTIWGMRFLKCARISYVETQVVHFNYSWREKRIFKTIVLNIKITNATYMSCNIPLPSSWYYEPLEIYCFFYYLKKRQSSCSIIVVVVIQNLVLDIFFFWNYFLWRLLWQVLHYIKSIRAFHEKSY